MIHLHDSSLSQDLKPNRCATSIFVTPNPTGNTTSWAMWAKPPGATFLFILALGAGGAGGNGRAGAAAGNRGGGGGGGAGGISTLFIPAILLPNTLFVSVGRGVINGETADASGIQSRVSIQPNTTINHTVLAALGGGVGAVGGTSGNAGGGAAGTAATFANCPRGGMGIARFIGGQIGATGGAPAAVGTNLTLPLTGLRNSGGAGGGGINTTVRAGGTIVGIGSRFPSLGTTTLFETTDPFFAYGGTGGASVNAATGENGSMGGYGSGGGGGGAGTTGGTGGQGGHGSVFIISW